MILAEIKDYLFVTNTLIFRYFGSSSCLTTFPGCCARVELIFPALVLCVTSLATTNG
jgi:hypothetical protein